MHRKLCSTFLLYAISNLLNTGNCAKLQETRNLCSSDSKELCSRGNSPVTQHMCEKFHQIENFQGQIFSPVIDYDNGTISYPPKVSCAWYIQIQPESIITLSFPYFELEEGQHHCNARPCCGDTWLSILSIPSKSSLPNTKSLVQESVNFVYCGSMTLPPLVFSGTALIITLKTGEAIRGGRGFAIDYTVDKPSRGSCEEDHFHCKNGKCVLNSWLCNGWDECGDYSDELNCSVSCKPGFARCNNSSSLCYDFNRGRCNGVLDCPGGEDEHACALNCGSQMACRTRGGCYRTSARCNGHHDCPDGSDEEGCDSSLCGPHREGFLCRNQRCIPAFSRCDGIQDCGDFSDEDSCMKMSMITAVILGSLVCGLLLVIAAGCGLRLYRLRIALEQRWSSIRLQHRAAHNHDFDEFGQRRLIMGRQPPPSYAQATGAPEPLVSSTSIPSRHSRRSHRHRRPAPPLPDPPGPLPQRPADPELPVTHVEAVETVPDTSADPSIDSTLTRWVRNIWRKNSPPSENLNDIRVVDVTSVPPAQPGSSGVQNDLVPVFSGSEIHRGDGDDDDFDTEPLIESQP